MCAALSSCLSPDEAQRVPAEQFLREAERSPGFCTLLLQVAINEGAGGALQQLAVLAAKNVIGRCWVKGRDPRAPYLAEDEKAALKGAVVQAVCSGSLADGLALQLSLIVAKISRSDFPRLWPELLPALAAGLSSSQPTVLRHTLRTLHYVLKEQTSKRLMRDRLDFMRGVVPQLIGPCAQLWHMHAQPAVAAAARVGRAELAEPPPPIVLSQLLDKCALRLLCHGYKPGELNPTVSPEAAGLLGPMISKATALYEHGCSGSGSGAQDGNGGGVAAVAVAPSLRTLLRGFCRLHEAQPKVFLLPSAELGGTTCARGGGSGGEGAETLLTIVLQLALRVLSDDASSAAGGGEGEADGLGAQHSQNGVPPRTLATALRFIALVLHRLGKASNTVEELAAQRAAIGATLTGETAAALINLIVVQHVALSVGILEEWSDNPEGQMIEEAAVGARLPDTSEEHDPRAWGLCTLLALSMHYADVALPTLGAGLLAAVQTTPTTAKYALQC